MVQYCFHSSSLSQGDLNNTAEFSYEGQGEQRVIALRSKYDNCLAQRNMSGECTFHHRCHHWLKVPKHQNFHVLCFVVIVLDLFWESHQLLWQNIGVGKLYFAILSWGSEEFWIVRLKCVWCGPVWLFKCRYFYFPNLCHKTCRLLSTF